MVVVACNIIIIITIIKFNNNYTLPDDRVCISNSFSDALKRFYMSHYLQFSVLVSSRFEWLSVHCGMRSSIDSPASSFFSIYRVLGTRQK